MGMGRSSGVVTSPGEESTSARDTPRPQPVDVWLEPHAAIRWARAVDFILDSPIDPQTVASWGHAAHVSASAIRSWCFTAGIRPRVSLVFGRLLRAVVLSEQGRYRPENVLDTVDYRTLARLLHFSGFGWDDFPGDVEDFLARQILVDDPDALVQMRRCLEQRHLL